MSAHPLILDKIKKIIIEQQIEYVSLKFCDLPGHWLHFTVPIGRVVKNGKIDEAFFRDGVSFDGSSPEGFKSIAQSDIVAIPDINSAVVDPIASSPTLIFICTLREPETTTDYWKDPRSIAIRAEQYLKATGIADTANFGPEIEFFLFDDVSWSLGEGNSHLSIVSNEGAIGTSDDESYARVKKQLGYFVSPPSDMFFELRLEMVKLLESVGIIVERDTHERATAGQAEIDIKYDSLLSMADKVQLFKYIVRNVASKHGVVVTFMPKPLFGHNGNGMHTHISLWKKGKPIFFSEKGTYHHLSDQACYFIGGILRHMPSLCALTSPSINSYRRLVPGFEAPTTIAFGYRNRSTCIRIPAHPNSASSRRIEVRTPDNSSNSYLCFAALLMAGLDGIKNKVDPITSKFGPLETSGYEVDSSDNALSFTPASLTQALQALESDHQYLTQGDVFTKEMIALWLEYKRKEILESEMHPTPSDFEKYFDC